MRIRNFGVSLIIVLTVAVIGLWQFQNITDWLALRNYTPPARVVKLADDTAMKSKTRRVFYINHPELNDKVSFNGHCRTGEQTIVLGCFIENKGIFLLDVTDPRLSGVIEVTTAHEVLHAEYGRLDSQERARVDKLTAEAFASLNDSRIKATVEQYRKQDPSIVPNELHSILGTEVSKLPPELEAYYSQYFNDRQKVVGYLNQYESAFVDLRNQVDNYDKRLESQKASIEQNESLIDTRGKSIDQERQRLDALLSSKQVEAYNNAIPEFNRMVRDYNSLVATTKNMIEQYNSLVEKRNAAATTEQALSEALDSSKLAPKQ